MPYDLQSLAAAFAPQAQNAGLPMGQALQGYVDPLHQAYQDYIGNHIADLFGAAPGHSPLGTWYQRYWALNGLPDPVKNSILYAPSYGEGEKLPPGNGPGGLDALAYEYQANPNPDERNGPLMEALRNLQDYRNEWPAIPDAYGAPPIPPIGLIPLTKR